MSERLRGLVPLEGKRVLEVGAGTGRDGILIAREGAVTVSLDYSRRSLLLVRSQLSEGDTVELCCADAFSLPFPDSTFDVVFHQGLLEHFPNPGDLIEENARVLKGGGILLVDVPQRYHYYTLIKHVLIWGGWWFAGWETEYSVGELERLLEKRSFTILMSYGEWFNPPIWYRMLRRALVPLHVRLPMYPRPFMLLRRVFGGVRERLLAQRWALYSTVIVGTIARKSSRREVAP